MRRFLTTAALLLAATAAVAADREEVFDRTFDVRPGGQFSLENVNGGVKVQSWDQPRVRIRAVKKVGVRDDERAKEALAALRIEVRPDAGGLHVVTHYPKRGEQVFDWLFGSNVDASVRYDITVPRTMNVAIDNVNGGIETALIRGRQDLETTNGKIEVARCEGAVDASTTNGAIRVELTQVAPNQSMSFETTNGRITLAVPASIAASIDASTTNGSIDTELPIAATKIGRSSLRGALNGGGGQIRLRTTNGGIDIRNVASAK